MNILQLFTIIVAILFSGTLNVHFAKKQGKQNLARWFFIGMLLGIVPILLFALLQKFMRKKPPVKKPVSPPIEKPLPDMQCKRWYYLDMEQRQIGPLEFTDLKTLFTKKELGKENFIWGEGMEEWKRIEELPEVEMHLTKQNSL